jgi:uncharacterized membrane protein YgcG
MVRLRHWQGIWWGAAAIIAALLAALAAYSGASAQEIPRLTERLTDRSGVIEDRVRIERAIEDLERDQNVQLWVLFVETTGVETVTDYADAVAAANSFGGNDALLIVAIEDRSDALWVGGLLDEVTDDAIDRMLTTVLEPRLADGDFEAGVAELAGALGREATTEPPGAANESENAGGGGGGVRGLLTFLGVIILVPLSIVGLVKATARFRGKKPAAKQGPAADLDRQANALLLETDDALREAEQELGFAEAQFSEADVTPFRQALEGARAEMRAAFELRQALDDSEPEPASRRQEMLSDLVARAEKARALLDAEHRRIEELRDLERTAPQLLPALPGRIDEVAGRLPEAERQYSWLQRFAEPLSEPVEGSLVEAQKRLDFARETVQLALAPTEGEPADVVLAVRLAQTALAEAAVLINGVAQVEASVRGAEGALQPEITAAAADLEAARRVAAEGRGGATQEQLAQSEALLESARREAALPRPNVLAALQQAQEANRLADAALVAEREAGEQRQREAAAFGATAQRAASAYDRADNYIAGRRGAVGEEPRTRLREAQRHIELSNSLAGIDLAKATAEAEAAERLAQEALRLAREEFEERRQRMGEDAGRERQHPRDRTQRSRDRDADVLGGLQGRAIGGVLAGAMRGRGVGFGGTAWGTPGKVDGAALRIPQGGPGRSRGGRW